MLNSAQRQKNSLLPNKGDQKEQTGILESRMPLVSRKCSALHEAAHKHFLNHHSRKTFKEEFLRSSLFSVFAACEIAQYMFCWYLALT